MPTSEDGLDQIYDALSQLARGRRVGRLHERFAALAGTRIDPPGRLLLRRIADEGQVRLGELAEGIGLDPSTVSRKAQQLERAGLVTRSRDREDRRAAVLSVSAEGKRLLRRFDAARRQVLAEVLAEWSLKDRLALARLLQRLAEDFTRYGGASARGAGAERQADAEGRGSGNRSGARGRGEAVRR